MSNRIILTYITCLIIIGCNKKQVLTDKYTLVASKEMISIKIDKNSLNKSSFYQFFNTKGIDYLAIEKEKDLNTFEVYNLNERTLVNRISIKDKGPNAFPYVTGFLMENNNDFIAINPTERKIGLINKFGNVKKVIFYDKDNTNRITLGSIPFNSIRPLIIDSTIFLCEIHSTRESFGILTEIKQKRSHIQVGIDLKSGDCKIFPITYPTELIGHDISGMRVCRSLGYNNCFVFNFGILNSLFTTDDNFTFKKISIETNYNFKLERNHWKYMSDMINGMRNSLSCDEVLNILYDKYNKCYFLISRQRDENLEDLPDFRSKFTYPHCFITILDKDFHFMGDVFFPDNIYSFQMIFVSPNGLYISEDHINNPSFSEDFMQFRLFKLIKL